MNYRESLIVIKLSKIGGTSAIWFSGGRGAVIAFGQVLAAVLLAIKDLVINIAAWYYITLFEAFCDNEIALGDVRSIYIENP